MIGNKKTGSYLSVAAAALVLIAMIFAIATGATMKDLSAGTVLLMIVAIIAGVACWFKDLYGVGNLVSSVCAAAGIMILLVGRLNKIGLILNGVVEEAIPAAFIIAVVLVILSMVLNCVAGFIGTGDKE